MLVDVSQNVLALRQQLYSGKINDFWLLRIRGSCLLFMLKEIKFPHYHLISTCYYIPNSGKGGRIRALKAHRKVAGEKIENNE